MIQIPIFRGPQRPLVVVEAPLLALVVEAQAPGQGQGAPRRREEEGD